MKFITVSELRAQAPKVITDLEDTREEVIITKKGKPVALIRLIEEGEFEIKKTSMNMKGGKPHGKGKRDL